MTVTVRIAPSPTGNLHIGTARTALFNWLFARHHNGRFILRVEDTDIERSTKEFEQNIVEGLRWLGITWDNAEMYRQRERLALYRGYLEKLLDSGAAFWCHHTIEELESEKAAQTFAKEPVRHLCSNKGTERARQPGQIIRLAVDGMSDREIAFEDAIRGRIAVQEKFIGDLSLAKNLDTPLYNFAVVADDIDMQMTHVIRGEDHISNTPKQLLIYGALGVTPPTFAHLPLILGADRSKLSKRHGATSISEYQKDYLPEALVNFMGLLGHTYSAELLSMEEMAREFDLAKVHPSGAVFDQKKLDWINSQYIKRLPPDAFRSATGAVDLPDAGIPLVTERLDRLSDARQYAYLWEAPQYDTALLVWKKGGQDDARTALEAVAGMLTEVPSREVLDELAVAQFHGDRGMVYWPLRVALSGSEFSPGPLELIGAIGIEEARRRVAAALEKLR